MVGMVLMAEDDILEVFYPVSQNPKQTYTYAGQNVEYIPRTFASFFRKIGSIRPLKSLGILFVDPLAYTSSDIGEKQVDSGMVVDLEECPCEHFACC